MKKILIVENEVLIANDVRETLENYGYILNPFDGRKLLSIIDKTLHKLNR